MKRSRDETDSPPSDEEPSESPIRKRQRTVPAATPFRSVTVKGQTPVSRPRTSSNLYHLMAKKSNKRLASTPSMEAQQEATGSEKQTELITPAEVDNHDHTEFPVDKSLKNMIRIISPTPFTWFGASCATHDVTDECLEFRDAASAYVYPSRHTLPTEFQQTYNREKTSQEKTEVTEYFNQIVHDWKEAYWSIYLHIQRNSKKEKKGFAMYCCFEKYTMLLETSLAAKKEREEPTEASPGEANDAIEWTVHVSPSTKALRRNLQQRNIPFVLPLDKKRGVPYYDSQDPSQVSQKEREKYEQSALTQICIQGEEHVLHFLQWMAAKFEQDLGLTFYLPRLVTTFPFRHAIQEPFHLQSSGTITRTEGTSTCTLYRIELIGDMTSDHIRQLCNCLQTYGPTNSDGKENWEMRLSTAEMTKAFHILHDSSDAKPYHPYLTRIVSSGEGQMLYTVSKE